MGNIAIIIRAVGVHHNGIAYDQEQLAKRFVDEMRSVGHTVLTAHVEGNGSVDVAAPGAYLSPITREVDHFAKAAYERYLAVSDGKSLVSGAELPAFDALDDKIKAAWRAAADPSAPRFAK